MPNKFQNKVVLVTGGTRGIGAAIVRAFLREGATVVATYRGNDGVAGAFRESVGDARDRLHLKTVNVAEAAATEALFSWIDETFPTLDVLVNNAGIRRDAVVGMMSEGDWDEVLATNLKGTYLASKGAVQRMSRQRRGRIITITSPSGEMGFAGQGNYAASKAGQVGLMRSLSKEVARRNLTVNCVSPGFIDTDLIKDLKDDIREQYKNQVPMARFGTPEEVSHAVLFLASDEAAYITGTTLAVTGGL